VDAGGLQQSLALIGFVLEGVVYGGLGFGRKTLTGLTLRAVSVVSLVSVLGPAAELRGGKNGPPRGAVPAWSMNRP
jgi:hypothetical protein